MTSNNHTIAHAIKLKARELHAQLATLTSALAILSGKSPALSADNDKDAQTPYRSHQDQFDAMMSILSHQKRSLQPRQLKKELQAKGQFSGNKTTINAHLAKAVRLGYVLKRADGYRASPTIQKITQKAAPKPHTTRRVNGVAALKPSSPGNYEFVLKALRAVEGPQKGAAIQAAANQLGASMTKDTAVYGFLYRAVKHGLVKKSADGYQITEKGKVTQ